MGQTQSSRENSVTSSKKFGTSVKHTKFHRIENALQEASKLSHKYFGGEIIQNDASMHQMQNELLLFDDRVKRILSRRKNRKQSNDSNTIDQNTCYNRYKYSHNKRKYNHNHPTIPEEDESTYSSVHNNIDTQSITNIDSSQRNKSDGKQTTTKF